METIRLNIIMTYPIHWDESKIMRDYIQNFYDAVGHEHFHEQFQYSYEDEILTMRTNVGFDKRWLYYIGTSTKRGSKESCAGKFGEGFKMASLVAFRDMNWSITMEARDWILTIGEEEGLIDGTQVSYMIYQLDRRAYRNDAKLTLQGVSEKAYQIFLRQVKTFYYEQNPRFGACIVKNRKFALYHRAPHEDEANGYIYARYQERYSFQIPLIVCDHNYENQEDDDRDRTRLYLKDATKCMANVFKQLEPRQALEVLELFQCVWGGQKTAKGKYFLEEELLPPLLHQVRSHRETAKHFLEKYQGMLLTDFDQPVLQNRKKLAYLWFRGSAYYRTKKLVLPVFSEVGIQSLEELCQKENGFVVERMPDEREYKYLKILQEMAESIFAPLIVYPHFPQYRVLIHEHAPVAGLARSYKAQTHKKNQLGIPVNCEITQLILQGYLFRQESFEDAATTYMHELLHQFGGDHSMVFRRMLLEMNHLILTSGEQLEQFQEKWRQVA